jgi:hypothetical protein
MKANPKKKKKSKGKISPPSVPSVPSVPSDPIPPEWLDLVPDHLNILLSDVLNSAEDTMALQVGNKPSMEELIRKSKKGDKKSFLDLIKINTSAHPFDDKEDSTLIIPYINADRDFYEQEWVQKILVKEMEDEEFRKDFWKAVFSRQNNTLYNKSASELKRYISIRKTSWEESGMTDEDIEKELIAKNYIKEWQYEDIDSFRRFLNRCGISRLVGRPRGSKNRT